MSEDNSRQFQLTQNHKHYSRTERNSLILSALAQYEAGTDYITLVLGLSLPDWVDEDTLQLLSR
jgi:hypothetical protein